MIKIAVTGYYGTGSSAIIDLLSEMDGVKFALGRRFEHTNLLCRDGLFDLATILFSDSTNYHSRDMAINRFKDEMYKQYYNDFGWYGSYKRLIGEPFKSSVDAFVGAISSEGEKKSLAHTVRVGFSPVKAILQLGARIILGKKTVKYGRAYVSDGKTQRFLRVGKEEFDQYARKFVNDYFEMCAEGDNIMVYDHLILPEQTAVVDEFFDEDFRLIIIDRDPRDVYFSDKFIWNTARHGYQKMPGPRTVEEFCFHWDEMHKKAQKHSDSRNIMTVRFEDLLYKYDETVKRLCEFCGITSDRHSAKKQYFDADKSIKNTQIFKTIKDEHSQKVIEEKLGYLLYDYPYEIQSSEREIF